MIAQVTAVLSGSGVPASASTNTGAAGYYFMTLMRVGSTGEEVRQLRLKLIAGGYLTGAASSYFGTDTEAAVKKFQTAHGISAVGYTGPSTRAALNSQ